MNFKRVRSIIGTLLTSLLTLLALAACATSQPAAPGGSAESPKPAAPAAQTVTLRLGHAVEPAMPLHTGAEKIAELVGKKTNGAVNVQVFPSAQLGSEKELVEGLQMGSIDMGVISSGGVAAFAPMQHITLAPYLFRDYDHFMRVYRGPIGDDMGKQLLDKTGIRALDFSWYYGVRHLTTAKTPVRTPADLKGLKIRTPNIAVMRDAIAAWGVSVTTMNPTELYTALQTGVVDGQENPPSSIAGWKLYEVQKYLMLTGHMMGNMAVMVNDKTYQALSSDQQKALAEAVREAGALQSDLTVQKDEENIKKLQELGMTVVEPQVEEFRKLSASIIPKYEKEWGEGLYQRVQDTK